jgi:hypothetical protein
MRPPALAPAQTQGNRRTADLVRIAMRTSRSTGPLGWPALGPFDVWRAERGGLGVGRGRPTSLLGRGGWPQPAGRLRFQPMQQPAEASQPYQQIRKRLRSSLATSHSSYQRPPASRLRSWPGGTAVRAVMSGGKRAGRPFPLIFRGPFAMGHWYHSAASTTGTNSNLRPSNSPRSLNFSAGMTSRARKLRVM